MTITDIVIARFGLNNNYDDRIFIERAKLD